MKLLGSTSNTIDRDKNSENVPHLETVELVLVHCNLVNNDYQQDSPPNHAFLKTSNSEFQEIKIWFTDQTSMPLAVEDKLR